MPKTTIVASSLSTVRALRLMDVAISVLVIAGITAVWALHVQRMKRLGMSRSVRAMVLASWMVVPVWTSLVAPPIPALIAVLIASIASATWVLGLADRFGASGRRWKVYESYLELYRIFPEDVRSADPGPVERLIDGMAALRDEETSEFIDLVRSLHHPFAEDATTPDLQAARDRLPVLLDRLRSGQRLRDR